MQGPVLWGTRATARVARSFWGKLCLAVAAIAFHAWSCWVMLSVKLADVTDEEGTSAMSAWAGGAVSLPRTVAATMTDSWIHRLRFKLAFEWEVCSSSSPQHQHCHSHTCALRDSMPRSWSVSQSLGCRLCWPTSVCA